MILCLLFLGPKAPVFVEQSERIDRFFIILKFSIWMNIFLAFLLFVEEKSLTGLCRAEGKNRAIMYKVSRGGKVLRVVSQ